MKVMLAVLIVFVSWGPSLSVRPLSAADLYHGQVIDQETGEPLVGAAVTVVWYKTVAVYIDRTRRFQSAQETVTDSQGKFSLSVSPGIDWNPFTVIIKEPEIVIYQPGYEPVYSTWLVRMGFKSHTEFGAALTKGMVVKLWKLKTEQDMRKFLDGGYLALGEIPPGAIPNLIAAFNAQRKLLGMPPLLD